MDSKLNKLLIRQIKRHFGSVENIPEELQGIFNDINSTYENFEDDILLLQNSIEISSQELRSAFQKHKEDAEKQAETIHKINKAISAINIDSENGFIENKAINADSDYLFDSLIKLIEERKRVAEELLESETRFRHMSDNAPVLIWKAGTDAICNYFNKTWLDFTGRTLEQEVGNGWTEGVHPDDFKYCLDTYLDSFKERRQFTMEFRLLHADGKYRWLLDRGVPRFTSKGIFTGYIGTCTDISENKRVEETLRNLSRAVEQSPVSILITDIKGNIEYGNPQVFHLAGYEPEELLGKNIRIFSSGEKSNEEYKQLWSSILSGNEWRGEFHNKKKNGDLYWEFESISAIKNSHGEIVNFLAIKEDITERKLAEETLQNERTLFRTIIDLIPDAVYVKDLQRRKIIANPQEVKLAGKESENEILNKTDFDIFPLSDQAQKSKDEDLLVLQSGKPILNIEGTLTDNEGNTHSLLVSKVPLYDVLGKITGIVGVTHDITERKIVEDRLRDAHKSLSDILNAAIHTSITATDVNGVITVFSMGAEKMLGYSAQELIQQKTPAIFHLESEVAKRSQELTRELGRPVQGFDVFVSKAKIQEHEERTWTYIRKDGTSISVNLIVTAIRDTNNEITGFLGIASDITKRMQAEEELKLVSTRLAMATNAGGIGVWEMDLTTNVLFADEQLFRLFGVEKKSINDGNEAWLNNIHPDDLDRVTAEIQMAYRNERQLDTEFRVCWPTGAIHTLRSMAVVQNDDSHKPIRMIGVDWDITEQKKTETVLLKARQDAEMANKAKSIFLANMSHEIRTPLNAIIGFSQLMNRDKHLTDTQRQYNISIIRAGEHLLSLINDILELSKMEAGRLELNPTTVDLRILLSEIQLFFKEQVESKHLQLIFEAASNIPRYVLVDDNKLRRIFINLIGNAIKFTDEGGIAVRVRTDQVNTVKSRLVVEIEDSGTGIPENEIGKLFKQFVQTSSGIGKSSGTGLGLALSRELAILMGGDITVSSEVGKGSVFTFTVEIEVGKVEAIPDAIRKSVVGMEKGMEDFRILVVDDTEENRQVVVQLLNLVGFITREAVNGEDAIVQFEQWNPHLILMDMRMPVMDGYEATRRIKLTEKGKQTPIVALTASSFEDEQKKIGDLGIHGYIRKPFRESELFGTIGNILGISYIFEDESTSAEENYQINDAEIVDRIAQLPADLVAQMQNAAIVADIDLLVDLIRQIDLDHFDLARHLMTLANNYDYGYLQQILNKKEIEL